nr:Chain C, 9-mer peptide [Canis lupus familiaris]5F1I_F Chain F, 9-mer peptide [Canis lupus familiaris]5F1I_I Chain I, 9-mer peptide [Canis lupus familiaris]5F1I_L Chain L, 9-mer peptide [Canis lupus familiaris]5F1I_O Chain O, 9-mer peptide [Canis lupus familiaris]5F1I_R Chain R, 9-mer peptide [Canis lupus familiaris]5F1I_U Chain U, 9-mer peptide [Canis lupus familiaris]5F1I_X Chain X, 9-mer peptide [Canis lupus familiaris]
KLFSGELTK